ncbi:hypothetical protein [Streptomyces lavendofoliae]|uniref:hypothetical protein n=1 Tax=Streptomyces lavendofoliae TaxID=67314 RepID=UPI003D8F45CC
MNRNTQFGAGVAITICAALGLFVLASQAGDGGGWQVPVAVGAVLLIALLMLVIKRRK